MLNFSETKMKYAANLGLFLACVCAGAQSTSGALERTGHSSTLIFVTKDGACMRGTISKVYPDSITVQPFKQQPVNLYRDNLLQISQGSALLFSARSSWMDVVNVHPYPRESLVVVTKRGKQFKGAVAAVGSNSITIKHGLTASVIPKSEIVIVDYLRWKPATDGFNLALEEAPWALFFYPELYGRAAGIEGKVGVRLFDASKPEDNTAISLKACFP